MTGRLTELLFTVQRPELGWQVLRRMARWVERFPYFPQTIYGDNLALQPHERNWYRLRLLNTGIYHTTAVVPILNSSDL